MGNSIEGQTRQTIEGVNASINEEHQALKKEKAKISQEYLVANKKDVVIPACPQSKTKAGKKQGNTKPKLPGTTTSWNGLQNQDEDEPSLIAIMGKVLALQAKTNSRFWSTLWKQASDSMMMEVKFAPIIGGAIEAQYTAESNATKAQASQSKEDGIVNLSMFGVSMAVAGFMEYKDPTMDTSNSPDIETQQEGTINNSETQNNMTQNETNMDKQINNENPKNRNRVERLFGKAKDKLSLGQKRLTGFLGKGMQASMSFSMASQGINGWFIDSKYQGQMAMYQGKQGQAAALSKEGEQYAQFYGQAFSRDEDLRQGSGQNIDFAMNTLKSAADSITQTVTSMFRG